MAVPAEVRVLKRVSGPVRAFVDRDDAGRVLAQLVAPEPDTRAHVFGLPRGGVPVARVVATALGCPMHLAQVRKLPIPTSPEMGFGAMTLDGTVTLNHEVMRRFGISVGRSALVIEEVRTELERRAAVYPDAAELPELTGRRAIVVDDGIATGYTMLATCEMLRRHDVTRLVVAAPVAPASSIGLLADHCDEIICAVVQDGGEGFAVASFYERFPDLTDAEVLLAIG